MVNSAAQGGVGADTISQGAMKPVATATNVNEGWTTNSMANAGGANWNSSSRRAGPMWNVGVMIGLIVITTVLPGELFSK